ncbi:MAG: hypothetical protein ABMA13_01540 [Chthoniobacteraceae bacterium]
MPELLSSSSEIDEACPELAEWMRATLGVAGSTGGEIAAEFCKWARERFALDLRTNWNPSACAFDARWQDGGRTAEGIERPFSAETDEEARLRACEGLLRLIKALAGP